MTKYQEIQNNEDKLLSGVLIINSRHEVSYINPSLGLIMSDTTTIHLRRRPRFIVDEQGNKVEAILDIETYRELMRKLEDFNDNLLIEETLGEKTIPLEDVLREEDRLRGH